MTPLEREGKRDPDREDLYKTITKCVSDGMSDIEIGAAFSIRTRDIWYIRRTILKINNYGRKRTCPKCSQPRCINLFSFKKGDEDKREWCIPCRRAAGEQIKKRGHVNRKKHSLKTQNNGAVTTKCLRCSKDFTAKIYPNGGHDHVCPSCKFINSLSYY